MRADRFTWQGLLLVLLTCAPAFAACQDVPLAVAPRNQPVTLSSPDPVPDVPLAQRRNVSTSAGDSVTTLYDAEAASTERRTPDIAYESYGDQLQSCRKPRQLPLHETSLPPPSR